MLTNITGFLKKTFKSFLQCFGFGKQQYSEQELRDIVTKSKLNHVAIIADGNRRWAKDRGLSPLEGHKKGFIEVAPRICEDLWRLGVHTVTIWCSSIANRKRAQAEVDNFMNCFDIMIRNFLQKADHEGIRIVQMGRKDFLPDFLRKTILEAEEQTKLYDRSILNLAIDYSGPDEMCRVYKKLNAQNFDPMNITEEAITQFSDIGTQPFPAPDLLMRPALSLRTSGFMPFQIIYTELHFIDTYFPSVDFAVLKNVILDFARRKRTFSK